MSPIILIIRMFLLSGFCSCNLYNTNPKLTTANIIIEKIKNTVMTIGHKVLHTNKNVNLMFFLIVNTFELSLPLHYKFESHDVNRYF